MNFIENESAQKLRGGFYTNADIADFLTRWVLAKRPESILEPSCGDGAFIEAILNCSGSSVRRVFGCEMDPVEADKAKSKAIKTDSVSLDVHVGDFLKWFLFSSSVGGTFDGVLGNPPFIRYQYLPEQQQFLAEKIFRRLALPFTKHTNAWVTFVIASFSLLAPGGRLGMVIPSEIFHIPHAQSLRRFLAANCSRILILDPEQLWFDDALQGVVLLLAEKKLDSTVRSSGVAVQSVQSRDVLRSDPDRFFQEADYINGPSMEGKWMPVFLSRPERSLLESLSDNPLFGKFSDVADVDVGIVTGANKFFLVTDEVVKTFGLQRWAHPMFGRSEHVAGVIYKRSDHDTNRRAGLPTNFLWFDELDIRAYPASVQRYIRAGESEGLTKRFKCRVRTPWFKVPSVYSAPVAMLKRAHHFPRLVLNKANVLTTDTAYRIKPKKADGVSLVYSFLNSVTCLSAELEGRHYGGGVLELVPSEIERLLLPLYLASNDDLRGLDEDFRQCSEQSDVLQKQDSTILEATGLSKTDWIALHEAWHRLRNRRQRNFSTTGPVQSISIKNGVSVAGTGA